MFSSSALLTCIVAAALISTSPAACSWWFISSLGAVRPAADDSAAAASRSGGGGAAGSTLSGCDVMPGLSRRQRTLCQRHPAVMRAVADGVKKGVKECQRQFSRQRWNCTTVDQSMGFGRILLNLGSREAAFVYAISSAGVVHSIAKVCASGQVPGCGCLAAHKGPGTDRRTGERFEWGGCGDNVDYAASFARRFIDSKERRTRDARALMNLHNNRAGRRVVKRKMRVRCKCHGVSGSCQLKTCWKAVAEFSQIGTQLYKRYSKARQVSVKPAGEGLIPAEIAGPPIRTQNDLPLSASGSSDPAPNRRVRPQAAPKSLSIEAKFWAATSPKASNDEDANGKRNYPRPGGRAAAGADGRRKLKRAELVYFEASPDYCNRNEKTGSLGTAERRCNVTGDESAGSCAVLCCGRGYNTKRVTLTEKCNCKFVWCCKVECETCMRYVDVHTCKAERKNTSRYFGRLQPPSAAVSGASSAAAKNRRRLSSSYSSAGRSQMSPRNPSSPFSAPSPTTGGGSPSSFSAVPSSSATRRRTYFTRRRYL